LLSVIIDQALSEGSFQVVSDYPDHIDFHFQITDLFRVRTFWTICHCLWICLTTSEYEVQIPFGPLLRNYAILDVMKKVASVVAIVVLIAAAVLGGMYLYNNKHSFVTLDSVSMEPTIKNGQKVRVHKYKAAQTPQRGDVVEYASGTDPLVQKYSKSGKLIHRVIALPGERITIKNGAVQVYNNQHPNGFNPDTYLASNVVTEGDIDDTLAAGMYFLMGDNRHYALDSRAIGPIPLSEIIGQVTY